MSNTIYCSSCGKGNQVQSAYCFSCGKALLKIADTLSAEDATQEDVRTGRLKAKQQLNNRYTLLSLLGQGGMGAVYKAEDTRFANRLVAIKEMSQSGLDAQRVSETTEQFKQEANILASLNHPNLPSIYDHFTENGRSYLVMDFVEGVTLERYASQAPGNVLPVAEVLNIGIQLAKVLNYLHTRPSPIIFRDLKPLNVMITPDLNVYLIDFGIARLFKQGQTKDTVAYVSQGYAAPEQFMNAQTTPQSDIYSLGATLHQLLSGSRPSANVPLFNFKPLPSSLPPALVALVMQMVSVQIAQRPASMAVVKQELEQIQQAHSQPGPSLPSTVYVPPQQTYVNTPFVAPVYPLGYADATVAQNMPVQLAPSPRGPKLLLPLSIVGVLLLIGAVTFGFVLSNKSQRGYANTTLNTASSGKTTLSPAATVAQVVPTATPIPTIAPTNTPTPSTIAYPSYSDAKTAIKYYYENESDFKGKNVIQQFNSLTYQAQTGPVDQPQFIACAQYTFALVTSPDVTADTARHTFTFQYGNNTWTVIDMGNWNSC